MSLDNDLSRLRRLFLYFLGENICDVAMDRMNFFVWELKTLDSFLALQSFTFARECGLLDVTQKMQNVWKTLYITLNRPDFDTETNYVSDADADANADAFACWEEFIKSSRRDKFIHPITFHVPTETDADSESGANSEFIGTKSDPNPFHVPTEIWKNKLEFRAKYSFPKISSMLHSTNKDDFVPTPKIVMEFIDSVEENLNVLLQVNDASSLLFFLGPKDQLLEVLKELKLLSFFVLFVSKKCPEPQSQQIFFNHVLIVAAHAAMVAWLYLPIHGEQNHDLAPNQMNDLLSDLLLMKIKPIHKIITDVLQGLKSTIPPGWHPNIQNKHAAHSAFVETPAHNLVELPATVGNPTGAVSLNDQMMTLQEMHNLLRDNLIHLPVLDLEFCLQDMDTVIVDAGFLVYSLYGTKGEKEGTMLEDVNRALGLDLPSDIQPIKVMVYLIIRAAFQSNLPRIHGLGYIDFLLSNLKEFQGRYSDSLASVMNQLQIIQKELESTQPFLKDVTEGRHNKHGRLQQSATLLMGKAYEVEYVVDACISEEVPQWCLEHWLSDIIQEIKLIGAEVEIDKKKIILNPGPHDTIDTASAQVQSRFSKTPRMTEEIVGFEEVRKEIRDKLIKGCQQLDVICIVGMPGLGKTTLAKQLYSDGSVVEHFDVRAQCCVSQVYKRMDLLLAILHDATTGKSPSCSTEGDAADQLRRYLLQKRYLIFVDDVWEASAWDDLKCCFRDAKNGSRIIVTTRHLEVANHATVVSKPIPLRMFDDDESWKLLEDRVFGKESCFPQLEKIGKEIAKRCGGLPLSIVLVAGILTKVEKKEESWKQVATTLGSQIHSDSKVIVEQSYQDLPCHLKPCFLYLGSFLEDRVINVSRLTRLWISEAFIKSCEGKSLEDIAEGYLENLVGRNLVMVSKRTNKDGRVKAFRIHDLLLEFCKKRAMEENFLFWIKRDQNANPSSCIYSSKHHAQRRVAFSEVDTLTEWSSSCSLVSSVLFRHDTSLYGTFAFSGIVQNFRFLKVLDLENGIVIDYFPMNLFYLRYLSAKTNQSSIPLSISNLQNLETLIFKFSNEGYKSVPITVWKMVKLRHLHLFNCDGIFLENIEELLEYSSQPLDLRTLSVPYFTCAKDAEFLLRKTPNLRELKCNFMSVSSGQLTVLDFPSWLEKLHILPILTHPYLAFPVSIFPSNLKKLRIDETDFSIQQLSNVAQLQHLQALHLYVILFEDGKWEVRDGEFPQLKVLKLIQCYNLEEWTVSYDAFPYLEHLVLFGCDTLEEIPSCFANITSLKSIKVIDCNESVDKSARDICEMQVEDYQNTNFKLSFKFE